MTNNTKDIWSSLQKNLAAVCQNEKCWLNQKFMEKHLDKNLLKYTFAPNAPAKWRQNPNEWLDSDNIIQVMKQYEHKYPSFKFIGPSPIDFDTKMYGSECVWPELCNFSLKEQIASGKTKIGIIFNTDTHDKGGEHWLSMFINIKKGKIFFFDSVGDTAPKEIMALVKRIQNQGSQLKKPINFVFDQNHPVEHQYGDTECGIYSLYFIVHMLEDKHTSEYYKKHILSDKYMQSFRKIYFKEELKEL